MKLNSETIKHNQTAYGLIKKWRNRWRNFGAIFEFHDIIKYMYEPKYTITNDILARISRIEELRTKARSYHILPEREAFIHKRATLESTYSSTSIEGNPLNIKQVEKALSSNSRLTKKQYAEIEVQNYKKSLDWISKRKQKKNPIQLTDVLKLHSIITDSLLDETRSGKLREYPVYIVNQDNNVIYDGPEPKIVKSELESLFTWLDKEGNKIHPVITAGIIHYMLASIHPFADGNGRTARATVSLYLSLTDYDFRESLVLDSYYAVDKKAYYNALKNVQNRSYDNAKSADITPWLDYFTEGFLSSAEVLTVELQALSIIQNEASLKRLSREESDILSFATEFGSIDLSEAQEVLSNISRRTIQRKLNKLVSDGYLKLEGDGPASKYIINKVA